MTGIFTQYICLPVSVNILTNIYLDSVKKIVDVMDKAKKMVYLAITEASKKWTMPIHNWRQAMVRFIVEFVDRLEKHIK
jgi:transposase-like protein